MQGTGLQAAWAFPHKAQHLGDESVTPGQGGFMAEALFGVMS